MKKGTGLVKINGSPLGLVTPELLRLKVYEPILILGWEKFANVSYIDACLEPTKPSPTERSTNDPVVVVYCG